MKKLFICLAFFSLGSSFLIPQHCGAQTFQFGSLIVSASIGADAYKLNQTQINNVAGTTKDTTTGAASSNFSLGGEFGVAKWLGLGLQFKYDNYFHDANIQSALGFESGLLINFHIFRHLHFDLLAGFNLGRSSLTITSIYFNYQVYGNGTWGDLHFTAREYIGRFGFSETLYFADITYNNLTDNAGLFNNYLIEAWKANGEGINIGVQYHFLK